MLALHLDEGFSSSLTGLGCECDIALLAGDCLGQLLVSTLLVCENSSPLLQLFLSLVSLGSAALSS